MSVFQEGLLFCQLRQRGGWVAVSVLAGLSLACGAPRRGENPYRVTIDLRPDIEALASDDLSVSDPAADRLAALEPAVLPALDAALRQEAAPVRIGVVGVLQQLHSPSAVALLIRTAGDGDPAVRREAILGLGLRRENEGRAVVEAALGDADPSVRAAAATACSQLCESPAAIETLVALALGTPRPIAPPEAVLTILTSRDGSRAAAAREAIERLAVPELSRPDASAAERLRAAVLVAYTGDAAAVATIENATRDAAARRFAVPAVLALASVPDPAAVAALRRIAGAGDPGLTGAACSSLRALAQRHVAGAAAALAACPRQGAVAN